MSRKAKRHEVLVASDVPYSRMLLKQALQQHDCSVRQATDVDDALQQLHQREHDLLIIDLVNPRSASEQLMLQVRVSGSTVPMLLLLAQLDRDLLRRLNNLRPVGFLSKPLNTEGLFELLPLALSGDSFLLRRSAELAKMRNAPSGRAAAAAGGSGGAPAKDDLSEDSGKVDEKRLQRMFGDLPLLPHVLTKIIQISGEADATARDLAQVISADPRLSGQLLRIVNSAYFGFSRRISTIPEATVILGIDAIRNLALGASVSSYFSGKSELIDRSKLWRHALAVAVASRKIAELTRQAEPQEAFSAGLLHDFGRLTMERYLTERYGQALVLSRETQQPILFCEEHILGVTHEWVGGWLAGQWNLPPVLAETLSHHHRPEAAHETVRTVVAAVNLGDVVCHHADLGSLDGVPPTVEVSTYGMGILGCRLEDVIALAPAITNETTQLEAQLSSVVKAGE